MRYWFLSLGTAIAVSLSALTTTVAQEPAAPATPPQEGPAPPQEDPPKFRRGVELMNLSITVTDKRGRPVTDLTRDDFVVFEDKQPQQIMDFSMDKGTAGTPIGLGLVLDASGSMTRDRLETMRTAVELMVNKRLRKEDELYFLEFATDARLITPWTSNRKAVIDAVRRIKTRDGTAIYNGIVSGLQVSKAGRHKKQVMLVITDGADTPSTIKRQDVALAARASDVVIYALVVGEEEGGFRQSADANLRSAAGELSAVTDATGGRTQYVRGFAELEKAVDDMGKEFTLQYQVAYQRAAADNRFHEITVGVKRPDVTVRHRRIYLAAP